MVETQYRKTKCSYFCDFYAYTACKKNKSFSTRFCYTKKATMKKSYLF